MGWHAADASWWPVISEGLQLPWSRQSCLMDLRWHGDRKKISGCRIPGRSFFIGRWGWTDKKARTLIASFDWWDSAWGTVASASWGPEAARVRAEGRRANRGPIEGQERSNEGPNGSSANANNGEGQGQSRANEGPIEGQERSTGVKETHAPSPPPSPPSSSKKGTEVSDKPDGPDPWQQVVDAWSEAKGRPLRVKRSSKVGQAISARLADWGLESCVIVARWVWKSSHSRAAQLRNDGFATPKTVFRDSNFQDYMGFAEDEHDGFVSESPPPHHAQTGAYAHDFSQLIDTEPEPEPLQLLDGGRHGQ